MPRPRSPLKSLAALLDRSDALVALFDEQRRLVYASAGCTAWLGVDCDDLLGRLAIYSSEPQSHPLDAAVSKLAPPPDAFAGQASQSVLAGPTGRRGIRFMPLAVADGQYAVLVVAVEQAGVAQAPSPSANSDWHAALIQIRAQLPMSLQSEYLAGTSSAQRRLREQVQVAAKTQARTVIVGPTGSGSLEIATTIHTLGGGRADGLVALQGALHDAETLQAAIRALSRKRGAAADVRSPALLLRDLHLLPAAAQQELLGFLQLPGFDLRILGTSRMSLPSLVKKGKFSAELASMLGTLELRISPLKDRPDDVPLLAQLFVERFNLQSQKQFRGFRPEAIEQLVAYDYPGNVLELGEMVRQSCERATGSWIVAADLPERFRGNWQELARPAREEETIDLDEFLAGVEKEVLSRALTRARGNKSEAARLLGLSRPRLLRRLVQLKLVAREEGIDFQPVDGEPAQEAS